jgi:basic membrane protein A
MTSHRVPLLTGVLVALFALASGTAAAADAPVKVGLLCSGSTSDGGWNQLAKEALDQLKQQLGAETSLLQKVSPDKAGDELRGYAADGYDLVICHGYEFLHPAADAAKAGGATHYAVSGADEAEPNLATLDFDLSGASYQVGILAARLSKSGKLGFIGGEKIPSVLACFRGFAAGAHSVRADIAVTDTYTSWDQPELSKSQAEALIKQGIDGIYHDVDAASSGIFEAVKEHDAALAAGDAPVYIYGSVANQNANATAGSWMPASAVIHLDQAFIDLAKAAKAGTFKAGVVHADLASGICTLVLNPALVSSGVIAPAVQQELDAAAKGLTAHTITVPAAP